MESDQYRKHFIPLESNAEVFTDLIRNLGVSQTLQFQDIYSLDDEFLPHPALALILIFPTSAAYEAEKAKVEATYEKYSGFGPGEDVTWFKQTINNACGLYAILHAVCNGDATKYIGIELPRRAKLRVSTLTKPQNRDLYWQLCWTPACPCLQMSVLES
jgi:ubiquitin carboxyl-terminal hydrolase L3